MAEENQSPAEHSEKEVPEELEHDQAPANDSR